MGSMPRRARQPIPSSPATRRRRVVAGCAVLLLLAHLLLAQLTLGLAVAFTVTGRVSRWRLWWLTGPAAAGLIWTLAIGPGRAAAGFAAGPAHVLGYLGRGDLLAGLSRASGPFAGAGRWLPGQLPIALIAGAAEAALIGWPGWRRAGQQSALAPRPGLLAAVRTRLAAALIRTGGVVTRQGCALGVAPATGAVVELRWPEMAGGVLVAGTEGRQVTVTGLQLAHAALRRRKPLIVVDVSADGAIARALAAACAATGTPLRRDSADADLGRVITERSAVLLSVGSAGQAARACADITRLAAGLRRIGVDGDGLVWMTGCEWLPADAVAALFRDGRAAGLAVLVGAGSPAAATEVAELAGLAGALLVHRIADPSLALALGPALTGVSDRSPGASGPPGWAQALADGTGVSAGTSGPTPGASGPPSAAGEPGLRPAPPASALLSLGLGEFVLAVNGPRRRTVTRGRLVPARLPRPAAAGQERRWRRLRYDPA
jgi:hypothetical protein